MLRSTLVLALFCLSTASGVRAAAGVEIAVCHGYGCVIEATIHYDDAQLAAIGQTLRAAVDAAEERKMLADVLGQLYAWAGAQSDIHNDRGGNYADAGMPGRMDCIDHATSTTRLLHLLAARGDLRWHRVLEPQVRHALWLFPAHYSAVIEEIDREAVGGAREAARPEPPGEAAGRAAALAGREEEGSTEGSDDGGEDTAAQAPDEDAGRFAVDSWFVDNGQPAVILPLGEWKKGAGPDV